MSFVHFLWDLVKRTRADGCTGLAAMIAYNFFLVLPALLIFIVAVISLFPVENLGEVIEREFRGVLPADALSLITRLVDQTLGRDERQTFLLISSLAGALYVLNSGYAGLISSLNRIYGVEERRSWFKVRRRALVLSVFVSMLILLSFALLLVVPYLIQYLNDTYESLGRLADGLNYLRWPVIVALALTGMETTYRFGPDGGPTWRPITPGTAFGVIAWLLATLAFGFYVNNFGSYDQVYGTLGAVIVVLTWMWISALIFLVGAEINSLLWERSEKKASGNEPQPEDRTDEERPTLAGRE
jgi:membrane protein